MSVKSALRRSALLHAVKTESKVYIAQNINASLDPIFHCFSTAGVFEYVPVLDEYGPLNLSYVIRFIEILQTKIEKYPKHKMLYHSGQDKRKLTNAVYLLGAYLVLHHGDSAQSVSNCFHWLDDSLIERYRGANFCEYEGRDDISMLDCWSALERVKKLGWLDVPEFPGGPWGRIDPDEYEHYSNPLNADMQQIIPGKLVVLKAPMDLKGLHYLDNKGRRHFSPAYLAPILLQVGMTSVISLNDPAYSPRELESHGLRHHSLDFGTSAVPSIAAVEAFFRIVDARGGVAIHSAGGYGRSGTLAALCLMRRHGFRASEAVAWLRICRPGSVDCAQHAFLCRLDAAAAADATDSPRPAAAPHGIPSHADGRAAAAGVEAPGAVHRPATRAARPDHPAPARLETTRSAARPAGHNQRKS